MSEILSSKIWYSNNLYSRSVSFCGFCIYDLDSTSRYKGAKLVKSTSKRRMWMIHLYFFFRKKALKSPRLMRWLIKKIDLLALGGYLHTFLGNLRW
jgi:hypothetical protein